MLDARAALRARCLEAADGDVLRAEHLWRAHIAKLQLALMSARRRAAGELRVAEEAARELRELDEPLTPEPR